MDVLKKIRGASLVETLTASVIIVVVFMIASASFNNVFLNTINADTHALTNRLAELKYLSEHDQISFPFYEEGAYWVIRGERTGGVLNFQVQNQRNGKESELQIPAE